ncbi:MAG: HAMP domain-containing protein [Gammaproteobacteria bacterium]|nr:HAMP domain-containing protein [Gammaproteobacteria bacterium]
MNTSLKTKLFLVTALMVLLFATQAAIMSYKLGQVGDNARNIRDTSSPIIEKSYQLKLAVVQIQQWLTDISATRALDGLDDGFDLAAEHYAQAQQLSRELGQLNPSHSDLYSAIQGQLEAFYESGQRMARSYVADGPAAGNRMMGEFDTHAESIQKRVAEAMGFATELSKHDLDQSIDLTGSVRYWSLALSALMITLSILAGFFMVRMVIGPICRTALLAHELAEGDGDLTRRLDEGRKDEIGEVARSINTFVDTIRGTVVSMGDVAGQLNGASGELTGVAGEGQHLAMEQLRETEAVAAAMTEMKASADEIARTANETATHTREAAEQAGEGDRVVENAAGVITALQGEVQRAQAVIDQLGDDSSNIGTVLDVIRGISEQTNLLALNAAIEAARAGEQGRGFAVVADEVRTLASRTQQSTEEIQAMISALQARARESVAVMAASRDMAEQSVGEVTKARALLDAIKSGIGSIQEMTFRIATAAEQQSHVSGDLDRSLNNIAGLARRNAGSAEATAAASTQLRSLSQGIDQLLGRFKTG